MESTRSTIKKNILEHLYVIKKLSVAEIAKKFKCSASRINYWLAVYKIQKRTISEAIYQQKNPKGDPFSFSHPTNSDQMFLFGLGLGLFWGEGSKKNIHAIKLSNSDPALIKKFMEFLVRIYKIDRRKLKFQILSYGDLDPRVLVAFWTKTLSVKSSQFFKTTLLKKRGRGTYLNKMKYGVIIVHFGNIKLRNLIISQIANIDDL